VLSAIAIGGGIVIAALLVLAATRPDTFHVERSVRIRASAESVFAFIEDFRQWSAWSPYEKLDPAMRKSYSGAPSGRGAVYQWAGNQKAGEGRMEITSAIAPHSVAIKLDFVKPFEGHNTAEFTIAPDGDSILVTWAVYGPQAYMIKVMSLFCSMDKLLGKEFEAGLGNLKSVAEGQASARASVR
jgi:hypothetical protein